MNKIQKTFFLLICILHICGLESEHKQMLAYIGLFLRVLLLLPEGSFLPLFSTSPTEKERKKKNTHLHYFYVEQSFAVSIMPS